MNRTKFLASLLTATTTPFLSFAFNRKLFTQDKTAFKTEAGHGRHHGHIVLKGVNANVLDVKVSGSDTEGGLAIFEQTSLSPGRGTPYHVHKAQDEVFYVIEGAYRFKVGEQLFSLSTGDSIFLPRQVPHAWTQVSTTGKMIVTLQPAGKLEQFFVTLAALQHEPDPKEVARIFAENEMEVVGPPLAVG